MYGFEIDACTVGFVTCVTESMKFVVGYGIGWINLGVGAVDFDRFQLDDFVDAFEPFLLNVI